MWHHHVFCKPSSPSQHLPSDFLFSIIFVLLYLCFKGSVVFRLGAPGLLLVMPLSCSILGEDPPPTPNLSFLSEK